MDDKICEPIFKCHKMILNPIFRSSILYWACHLDEKMLSYRDVRKIYDDISAYPECPNSIDGLKNAFHKCAI